MKRFVTDSEGLLICSRLCTWIDETYYDVQKIGEGLICSGLISMITRNNKSKVTLLVQVMLTTYELSGIVAR